MKVYLPQPQNPAVDGEGDNLLADTFDQDAAVASQLLASLRSVCNKTLHECI